MITVKNKTKKVTTSLVVAGIVLCGSVAIGATSAEASSAFGNWNENDVASYDTNDAYGAVRSGSAWNENDAAMRDGTCDVYVDADGDGICDNCLRDDCVTKGDGACQNAQGSAADGRCYVDADGDGVCDNCLRNDCKRNVNSNMSARCENVGGRNYVNADDDGIYDNYASRHDGDNTQHHQERHGN